MFGNFRSRDAFLIFILAAIGAALVGAGWFVSGQIERDLIREQARSVASNWGNLVQSRLSEPDKTLLYGKMSREDEELVSLIGDVGAVYRYRFYNQDGVVVLASRLSDLGQRETRDFFDTVVKQGREHVIIETAPQEELSGRVEGTPTIAEAYVPVMENGRFKGAVGVYVDTTSQVGLLSQELNRMRLLVGAVVVVFGLFVAILIVRSMRERNREVDTIKRAHESLAKAEAEVLELNDDLEKRVEARTAELEEANKRVQRLNEDLEQRVAERTEQLNKTNEQLFRAVETANKINESLEQRVSERTAELNKANETMMRMNAELEQRVAERTAEVNKAYDDIRELNEDLEKRVEARTAELEEANKSIQDLNTDLERRVEERTTELAEANKSIQDLNADLERRVEERTAELREAQQGLLTAERLATLGQLTATVSHELRNPLGAIRTAVYLISTKTRGQNLGVEDALLRAERSIGRCDSIINELLDFTRQTPLALEDTTFDEWLDQVLDEQKVPETVSLRRGLQAGGARLAFDRERLRRVMINLVSNACEAMKEQQESGGHLGEHVLDVVTRADDSRLEILVRDNGPGIEPDKLETIFEPLFSTKSFGVGLGLPIVRQIVEQHGGGIEVESEIGKGTIFKVWIPTDLGKDGESLGKETDGDSASERAA